MEVSILTDSTACLPRAYAETHGVYMVPLTISSHGEEWVDGFAGETPEVFQDKEQSFHTSQPPVAEFDKFFKAATANGNDVVAILITEGLSGTTNAARLARDMSPTPERVHIVDSGNTSIVTKFLVERAVEMAESGATATAIVAEMQALALRSNVMIAVRTLDYLHFGGRLTRAQALLGGLLQISPVVTVAKGKVVMVDKVRLFKRALQEIARRIPETTFKLGISHLQCPQEANDLTCMIKQRFPKLEVSIESLSPVVAAHLGPCVGIGFQWK